MKTLSILSLWLASCILSMGAGAINGVAVTGWNGVAITAWNGTGVSVGGGGGGPALVFAVEEASADAQVVTTPTADSTTANLIVISVSYFPGTTPLPSLSDSEANTWLPLTSREDGNVKTRLFYCYAPTTDAAHTFTFGGILQGIYASIQVAGFSGIASSPFDVENGSTASASATISTGAVTPSQANTLVIAALGHENNSAGAVSINSGFTIAASTPFTADFSEGGSLAYKVLTSSAEQNPQWNVTTSTVDLAATIAVFKY